LAPCDSRLTVDPGTPIEFESPVEGFLDVFEVILVVQTESRVAEMDE
jgi:hypothetical protein